MNTQSTVEQMQELKLFGMSKLYQAVIDQPIHQHPEAHTLMGMLTDANIAWHNEPNSFCAYPNSATTRCLNR